MQVLHDCAAPQVKEVLADASIARPTPLLVADVGQPMLHRHPFAQLSAPQRGQLPLAQLPRQSFIGVDRDAVPTRAGGALRSAPGGRRSSWLRMTLNWRRLRIGAFIWNSYTMSHRNKGIQRIYPQ
jgi:hypothetical protein